MSRIEDLDLDGATQNEYLYHLLQLATQAYELETNLMNSHECFNDNHDEILMGELRALDLAKKRYFSLFLELDEKFWGEYYQEQDAIEKANEVYKMCCEANDFKHAFSEYFEKYCVNDGEHLDYQLGSSFR